VRTVGRRLCAIAIVLVAAACTSAENGQPGGTTVHPGRRDPSPTSMPQTSVGRTTPATTRPKTTRSTQPSAGPLVVLDPGHNGGDIDHLREIDRLVYAGYGRYKACNTTGTETDAGFPEHRFNWLVANLVRRTLVAHGVRVIMTRHSDTGVGPCVNRRAAIESTPGVAAAVAIHADGAPANGRGFHVNEDSRLPEHATRATRRASLRLGRALHAALVHGSGLVTSTYAGTNGYYFRDDLAGLNLSTSPTSFLELGNMRNAHDAALQTSARGRRRIAAAVAAGILAYLNR
jgi:N-acetylmuramoyl-L-alanine amidase